MAAPQRFVTTLMANPTTIKSASLSKLTTARNFKTTTAITTDATSANLPQVYEVRHKKVTPRIFFSFFQQCFHSPFLEFPRFLAKNSQNNIKNRKL